jgi:hypothetical protein
VKEYGGKFGRKMEEAIAGLARRRKVRKIAPQLYCKLSATAHDFSR